LGQAFGCRQDTTSEISKVFWYVAKYDRFAEKVVVIEPPLIDNRLV
jgi:hypothetical protein